MAEDEVQVSDQSGDESASGGDQSSERQGRRNRSQDAYDKLKSERDRMSNALQQRDQTLAQMQRDHAALVGRLESIELDRQTADLPAEQRAAAYAQAETKKLRDQYEARIAQFERDRAEAAQVLSKVGAVHLARELIDELELPRTIDTPKGQVKTVDYLTGDPEVTDVESMQALAKKIAGNMKGGKAKAPAGKPSAYLSGSGSSPAAGAARSVNSTTLEERNKISALRAQGLGFADAFQQVTGARVAPLH